MSEGKTQIATDRGENHDLEPLMAVVEYCLARGMRLIQGSSGQPFVTSKKGRRCSLTGDTTIDDVLQAFIFPDHILTKKLSYEGEVWDRKHDTKILLYNPDLEAQNLANLERWAGPL